MHALIFAAIAAVCSSTFDQRYASIDFGRTMSPIMEYGGDCSRYCLDKRPGKHDGWSKGTYSCGSAKRKFWKCTCMQCQRDCELSEVMADRRCEIDALVPPKFDVAGKVMGSIGTMFKSFPIDFASLGGVTDNEMAKKIIDIGGKVVSGMGSDEAPATGNVWADSAIGFAKDIFGGVDEAMEMDELATAIALDINRRTGKLIDCMDAKIAAFENKIYDWSVKEAFSSYQIAATTDEADIENKADKVHDAWADHVNVIRSKFIYSDDALFVYTLLKSGTIANLMTTFSLVSTDYLKYLGLTRSSNFDSRYKTTLDCYDLVLNYVSTAKDTIAAEFRENLMEMPCRNGFSLDKEISKWEEAFYPVHYDPLEEYKSAMEEFKKGLPDNFYDKLAGTEGSSGSSGGFATGLTEDSSPGMLPSPSPDSSTISCSVVVLSVDHESGAEGKYFNFDKEELDAILGRTDWSNERLAVSNGKAVKVWRNPNGGSKGDAHGRWDEEPKENQWSVGDEITFSDCLSSGVEGTMGLDPSFLMKAKGIASSFLKEQPAIGKAKEIASSYLKQAKKDCSVDVLSVDHESGAKGKYFNFDKKALDAILGRTNWSNERLVVSNGKKVKVWRNANGGSKGDAHGRWDVSPKENQWSVGAKVTFLATDCLSDTAAAVGAGISGPGPDPCELPKVVGPCRARLSRYYYDASRGQCERFFYGGCSGNANNFNTQADCEAQCE